MKNFKYILSILFVFLGAFSGDLKAEIVIVDNDEIESYSEQDFKETSTEIEWLSLLYLQEGSHTQNQYLSFFILIESSRQNFSEEVCLKSKVETSRNEFQFLQTSSSHQRKWEEVDKVYIGYAELVDSWRILDDAGRTGLKTNVNALEALQNLRSHPKMASFKQAGNITDADLASIQGFSGASFEEVTNQITRLLDNHSSSTLNGFESVISTMKRTGGTQADNAKKGMYWVIRDVADDVDNLAGKNLTLEFGVPNARGNTSRIDVFCSNCDVPNLKIEYKSGPGSISSSTIKEQFIERDLFNASSLDEIQWRMDGTDFTADKLKTWLKENKNSITDIIDGNDAAKSSKFKEFFEMSDFDDVITDSHIDDFVDSNYDLIFR